MRAGITRAFSPATSAGPAQVPFVMPTQSSLAAERADAIARHRRRNKSDGGFNLRKQAFSTRRYKHRGNSPRDDET